MPSMAARGYWKSGAIGCRGASWSEQLDDKELRGALGSAIGTERIPVFWTSSAHASSSATVCTYDYTYSKSMDQPGKVANPARGQLNRENKHFPDRVRA